jgi:hypothetical protein
MVTPQRGPAVGSLGGSRERPRPGQSPRQRWGRLSTFALDSPVSRRPDEDHPGRADDMPLTIDDHPDEPCRVTTCSPAPVP